MLHSRKRLVIIVMICFALVLSGNIIHFAHAQDNAEAIAFGENKQGQVVANQATLYMLNVESGDVADITVLAFDFVPTVQILDQTQAAIEFSHENESDETTIQLQHSFATSGTYYLAIRAKDAASSGLFAISLARGERNLPAGVPLGAGQALEGTVIDAQTPSVFDFATNPEQIVNVHIRSLTDGYHPTATILTEQGEVVGSFSNPRLLGITFTLAPGNENLKLVVEQGSFSAPATFEVSLATATDTSTPAPVATQSPSDGNGNSGNSTPDLGVGLATAPTTGCYVSVNQRTNIRSGGSTSHPIIAVLGVDGFLAVTGYNSANSTWYQVAIPDGRIGWMSATVVQTGGNCANLALANYTPIETPEPTQQPTAVIVSHSQSFQTNQVHDDRSANGTLSAPEGINQEIITISMAPREGEARTPGDQLKVEFELVCTGTGMEYVNVSGISASCNSGEVTAYYTVPDNPETPITITIVISLPPNQPASVDWDFYIDINN